MVKGKISDKEKQIIREMRGANKSYAEIADVLRCNDRRIRKYCSEHNMGCRIDDADVFNTISNKYSRYEYIGGYTGSEGSIYLICKDCGEVFKYTAQILRPSANRQIKCPGCKSIINDVNEREIEEQKKRREDLKDKLKAQKEKEKREAEYKLKHQVCQVCGKQFEVDRLQSFCSDKCKRKAANRYKEIRKKNFRRNGRVDTSISLERLIKRDKGICQICGGKIDAEDYRYDEQGTFIVGNNYPTIDHIKPRARGGTHTMDNVQLAHRSCNSKKSAKMTYELGNGQMRISV